MEGDAENLKFCKHFSLEKSSVGCFLELVIDQVKAWNHMQLKIINVGSKKLSSLMI
jgi:hypothetical protein